MPWIVKLKNKKRYYVKTNLGKFTYTDNLQEAKVFNDRNRPKLRDLNSSQEFVEVNIVLKGCLKE